MATTEKDGQMVRETDFMSWINHQVDTDADLKRNVVQYFKEMMIEQKLAELRSERRRTPRCSPSGSA